MGAKRGAISNLMAPLDSPQTFLWHTLNQDRTASGRDCRMRYFINDRSVKFLLIRLSEILFFNL